MPADKPTELSRIKLKLDRTRRKAVEICLLSPLDIYSHTFSRWCPGTSNMISFSQRITMRKIHRALTNFPKIIAKIAPKLEKLKLGKSTGRDHNLISSEGGQDTSACQVSGYSLHASSGKCPETSLDRRTDMPQNGHGCSDGPTDPCTGGNRVFQASDRQTDNPKT